MCAALLIAAFVPTVSASAQDSVWIGGSGVWAISSNWQSNLVPNFTRDAYINNGGTGQIGSFFGIAEANSLTLGSNLGQSGTVQVFAGGTLTTDFNINVGRSGTGALAVSGGGVVISSEGFVGSAAGSSGAVTATGAGSRWDASSSYIGLNGSGTMLIENGAAANATDTYIGANPDSNGLVTVTGAGPTFRQLTLVVGYSGVGTLRVENGGTVHSDLGSHIGGVPGPNDGGIGDVTVTGPGSRWSMRSLVLSIGGGGTGALTISDSGSVVVEGFDNPGRVSINAVSTLNLGSGGPSGALLTAAIENNGTLNFNHADAVTQSAAISGTGQIIKNGAGSTTLTNASAFAGVIYAFGGELILQGSFNAPLYAASTGGTLRFEGSTVNMTRTNAIRSTGGAVEYSAATVNGGVLRGQLPGAGSHTIVSGGNNTRFNGVTILNSVDMIQNNAASLTNVTNGGRLTSNAFLFCDGGVNSTSGNIIINQSFNTRDFTNYGQITINSGGTLFHKLGNLANGGGSRTTVNSGGIIVLMDGSELDLNGALLVNNGTINGTVNVHDGSLAKGAGVYQNVIVTDRGTYAPGNSTGVSTASSVAFDNTPTSSGGPTLEIELTGTAPGAEYDQLHVTGQLSLGGTLAVSLINNSAPATGSLFDILDWGSLIGTFSTITLPALAGGRRWDVSQLYTTGVLSVLPAFDADFDEDGDVDGADLADWKSGFATNGTATHMQGDADGDQDADGHDFLTWQRRLGSRPAATASVAAVPEPSSSFAFLMGWAAAGIFTRSRRLAGRGW